MKIGLHSISCAGLFYEVPALTLEQIIGEVKAQEQTPSRKGARRAEKGRRP